MELGGSLKSFYRPLVVVEQLLGNDRLDERRLHRVDKVGEPGEAVGVLLREEILARRDDLSRLRVEPFELLNHIGEGQ